MTDITITVDLSSAQREMDKVAPEQIGRRLRGGMEELLAFGQREVRAGMKVDTGRARASVATQISGSAAVVQGQIVSPELYVEVMDQGRRPGARPPPSGAIARWLSRHGGDPKFAFVVARAIGRRGLPALHMFQHAAEQMQRRAQGIFERHLKL